MRLILQILRYSWLAMGSSGTHYSSLDILKILPLIYSWNLYLKWQTHGSDLNTLMCLETFFFFIFYFITVKNLPTINNSIMKIRWSTISTILKSSKSMAKFWIKRAIHLQWKHKALPPSQHMGVSLHLVQTWICNYTLSIWWDIIAYPCPRVNGLIESKGHPDPFSGWDSEARKDKGNLSEIYLKLTSCQIPHDNPLFTWLILMIQSMTYRRLHYLGKQTCKSKIFKNFILKWSLNRFTISCKPVQGWVHKECLSVWRSQYKIST